MLVFILLFFVPIGLAFVATVATILALIFPAARGAANRFSSPPRHQILISAALVIGAAALPFIFHPWILPYTGCLWSEANLKVTDDALIALVRSVGALLTLSVFFPLTVGLVGTTLSVVRVRRDWFIGIALSLTVLTFLPWISAFISPSIIDGVKPCYLP